MVQYEVVKVIKHKKFSWKLSHILIYMCKGSHVLVIIAIEHVYLHSMLT